MKRTLRRIRHRICRTIYYYDQCPKDYRRNWKKISEELFGALCLCVIGLFMIFFFCWLGF